MPEDELLTAEQEHEESAAFHYIQKKLEREQQAIIARWDMMREKGWLDDEE
jgi:hypothetical protein